jgi:DEAD/DEAH box helicase domain-containing protein
MALKWWQEGRISQIIDYCRKDVRITRDLYLFGKKNGYLLFRKKDNALMRVPVNW